MCYRCEVCQQQTTPHQKRLVHAVKEVQPLKVNGVIQTYYNEDEDRMKPRLCLQIVKEVALCRKCHSFLGDHTSFSDLLETRSQSTPEPRHAPTYKAGKERPNAHVTLLDELLGVLPLPKLGVEKKSKKKLVIEDAVRYSDLVK